MRVANDGGRAVLVAGDTVHDIERVSGGAFGPEPTDVFDRWSDFTAAAEGFVLDGGEPLAPERLGPPVPRPRQIFAIGLNYRDHARETGMEAPSDPVVFTKFQSALAGPHAEVPLPSGFVDYEAELVVVVGREAHQVAAAAAWDHVAGLTVGQDYSERKVQNRGSAPQFSLAKSFPNFAPTGPFVVTTDELADRDALRLGTRIISPDGEQTMQDGTTADLIFDVPTLVARLSEVVTLYPGDLIFTGTPSGVGIGRDPKLFLQSGWTVVTTIDGVGELRNALV